MRKLIGLVVVLASLVMPSSALANWTNLNTPVIFVHGFAATGTGDTGSVDCGTTWGDLENQMRAAGVTSTFKTIGYYPNDSHCDFNLRNASNTGNCPYNGQLDSNGYVTVNTKIQEISCLLAWYINNNWTSSKKPVTLEAHSMGGLIVTYMLDAVKDKRTGFPNHLWVKDVVTAGTPYNGARLGGSWDAISFIACVDLGIEQCVQMDPNVDPTFLNYINTDGKPFSIQQSGTTNPIDWTALGADSDARVDGTSAVYFPYINHAYRYDSSDGIGHTDYMHRFSPYPTYLGYWYNQGTNTWSQAPNLWLPGTDMVLALGTVQ